MDQTFQVYLPRTFKEVEIMLSISQAWLRIRLCWCGVLLSAGAKGLQTGLQPAY
jgi:hypothetical protein